MMLDEDWEAIQDGMEFEARLKRQRKVVSDQVEQHTTQVFDSLYDDDNPDIGDDSD